MSTTLLSPAGIALQRQLGCNYTNTIAVARQFYQCSDLDTSTINVVVGGIVEHFSFSDASAMAFGDTVYLSSIERNYTVDGCLEIDVMVHECEIVWFVFSVVKIS
jgi:hypothetical protein